MTQQFTGEDETEVKATMQTFIDSWNAKDAARLGTAFRDNCSFVDVLGRWFRSRSEVEQSHANAFKTFLGDSVLTVTETDITVVVPQVAILRQAWETTHSKVPGGEHRIPDTGVWTATLDSTQGSWRVVAFQNTATVSFTGDDDWRTDS